MIAFATPWALLGLVAAAFPFLLHLTQRRQAPEIIFPAVRYLQDATRQEHRRVQLRDWLLLALRTLLILALTFAAAGASMPRWSWGPHTATAIVLVVDNGATSAAVRDGRPELAGLVDAADRIVGRATPDDRLWLLTADGIATPGSPAELRQRLGGLTSLPVWFDLARGVRNAESLLRDAHRTGHVVIVTTLPRSEMGSLDAHTSFVVVRPSTAPPANRGVVRLTPSGQPWTPPGGSVTLTVASSDTAAVPVSLAVGGRVIREILAVPGIPSVQRITTAPTGWTTISASVAPDEFRIDDVRETAVLIAPPPRVQWDSTDRYVATAAAVLAADGRIRSGRDISLGTLGPSMSVVVPPDDPARLGALNRALASRGAGWRFGALINAVERFDSGPLISSRDSVSRRYALVPSGAGGHVLATVAGQPWAVADGNLILLGSRLDPAWTALPVSAAFVPMLDALLTRFARQDDFLADVTPGGSVVLPARTTTVVGDSAQARVQDGTWRPATRGVFHLLAGADTLGAITVQLDPRVSNLTRATDREVRAQWPGATVGGLDQAPSLAFAAGGRADLRGALLLLALCCALAETVVTGRLRHRN